MRIPYKYIREPFDNDTISELSCLVEVAERDSRTMDKQTLIQAIKNIRELLSELRETHNRIKYLEVYRNAPK